MHKVFTSLLSLCFCAVLAQDDLAVVRSILEAGGFSGKTAEDVTVLEDGRVVELDLNNPDVVREGLSELPASIGSLTACRKITINDNNLVRLPEQIGAMTALEVLEVKNNRLESLPEEIGMLKNLKELDLRNNELVQLPSTIGKLDSLWKLQLWGNELQTVPQQIGELTALREVYLKGNNLGTLPGTMMGLNITYLDHQENQLCGLSKELDAWMKKFDDKYESWQKCWKK
jgi:leucine-rich repeat protein SHOC2